MHKTKIRLKTNWCHALNNHIQSMHNARKCPHKYKRRKGGYQLIESIIEEKKLINL